MRQTQRSKSEALNNTNTRLGSALPPFALLLVGLSFFSFACSSGSGSPTEPPADPISFNAAASDDGVSGSTGSAEVDGAVTGVDVGSQTIFLGTGDEVVVDFNTVWDPRGDLFSFSELVGALNAGRNVRVEADGSFIESGAVLADTIKAETDNDGPNDNDPDDDSDGGAEVDGAVTGVDVGSQTIFLGTGDEVVVDFNTVWDPRGDLFSFSELVGALNAGRNVRVEADGSFIESGAVLADTIKAEIDNRGPNDNDPDDDSDDSDDSDSGDDSDDSDSGHDGDDSDNSGQG